MSEAPTKPRRRWFRFSLRTLLLLVAIIGVPLGMKMNRVRNQRLVVAELRRLNAQIMYDYEDTRTKGVQTVVNPPQIPGPAWLRRLLGDEYFVEVISVRLDGPKVTDETVASISKLPNLRSITLDYADKISDKGLAHLEGMQLEGLGLTYCPGISDEGLAHLARMQDLESLALFSDRITSAGLERLTGLKRLKILSVSGRITDSYLEQVSKLSSLEEFLVYGVAEISDIGLGHIGKLTELRGLHLLVAIDGSDVENHDCMKVTDVGLSQLYGLKKLKLLQIRTSLVTPTGIEKLQEALQHCTINWNNCSDGSVRVLPGH